MSKSNGELLNRPTEAICYAYAAAMHLGQRMELNLRAILWAANYHGWGAGISLDEAQLKRFRSTSGFIDEATCGSIIRALKETDIVVETRAWKILGKACTLRNELAHSFLAEHDFAKMTRSQEAAIVERVLAMVGPLHSAMEFTERLRQHAEQLAEEEFARFKKFLEEDLGFGEYDDPQRNYIPPRRRKKSGPGA